MANIARRATPVKPITIYPYLDKIQFWVQNPLKPETLAMLKAQCGRGGIHIENKPARFSAVYRQRVQLRQPSDQAIRWLAHHEDILMINQLEVALDLLFGSRADRDITWNLLDGHLVRRWHGKKQKIRIGRKGQRRSAKANLETIGTRYDAGRGSPNLIAFYAEEHTRVTGELHCLHLEWRLNKRKAVSSIGVQSGKDLLHFVHRSFWKKRLRLCNVDKERLGRLISNHTNGKKSRKSKALRAGKDDWISADERIGENYVRACDTTQELIDCLRQRYGSCRLNRALVPISNEIFLPT